MSETPNIKLKHDLKSIMLAKDNTSTLGAFAKSAYRRSLGSDEKPSDVAVMADAHMAKIEEWAGFTRELFGSLYDPTGMKKLPEGMGSEIGTELMTTASTQAAWSELRAAARCHSLIAAEATSNLAKAVAQATGLDAMKDDDEANQSPEDLQRELENIEDMEIDPNSPDASQQEKDKQEAVTQIKTALQKALARRKALSEKLRKNSNQIGRAVRQTAKQAQKAAEAVQALHDCGVGTGQGSNEKDEITPEMIKQAMQMEDFAKIIAMVGRMQQATDEKAEEADGLGRLTPIAIRGVKEITDVLPSELAMYPASKYAFLKRLIDAETMGVERESPEPKHKGDVLIFIDKSWSMSGEPIAWAKAMGVAAIQRAIRENRRWVVVMYAGQGDIKYASSDQGFAKALEVISVCASGGTDTDWAIRTVVKNSKLTGGLRDPDILLITDGDWADLSQETQDAMKDLKTRLFVVQLAGYAHSMKGVNKLWRIENLDIDTAANVLVEVTL